MYEITSFLFPSTLSSVRGRIILPSCRLEKKATHNPPPTLLQCRIPIASPFTWNTVHWCSSPSWQKTRDQWFRSPSACLYSTSLSSRGGCSSGGGDGTLIHCVCQLVVCIHHLQGLYIPICRLLTSCRRKIRRDDSVWRRNSERFPIQLYD